MQSIELQTSPRRDTKGAAAAWQMPAQATAPDRVTDYREAYHYDDVEAHQAGASIRNRLADAFRKLGVGAHARAAYERVTGFYRSSGHDWTHDLRWRVGPD